MVNVTNYFLASRGTFKVCPKGWAEKAFDHVYTWSDIDCSAGCPRTVGRGQCENIVLGNRVWLANFVSYNARWYSLSAYWVSPDGQWLLRLSDHWSESNCGSVHTCGWIRSCFWKLAGVCRPVAGRFYLGIVRIADLEDLTSFQD